MNIKVNYLETYEKYNYTNTNIYKIYSIKDLEISIKDIEEKGWFLLNQYNKGTNCIKNYYTIYHYYIIYL